MSRQRLTKLYMLLVIGGGAFMTWLGGKTYRIGIYTTGKKPTLGEVARWLRKP